MLSALMNRPKTMMCDMNKWCQMLKKIRNLFVWKASRPERDKTRTCPFAAEQVFAMVTDEEQEILSILRRT